MGNVRCIKTKFVIKEEQDKLVLHGLLRRFVAVIFVYPFSTICLVCMYYVRKNAKMAA